MDLTSGAFWAAVGSIVIANVVLSGDNAVVIALAARGLAPSERRRAIIWGSAAAIVMRIGLTIAAVELLRLPYLKIIGAVLLLYIGVKLLADEKSAADDGTQASAGTVAAVRTILVADLVMSLDNVLAIAAAANGDTPLLIAGLGLSIPLIIFGSSLLLTLMERFPIIVTLGGAVLGYLAAEMLLTDPAAVERFGEPSPAVVNTGGAIGAALVVSVGQGLRRRAARSRQS